MEQITWTEDFSVGVVRLDEQHKRLIQMINRLIAKPQTTTESEMVSDLLSDMTNYAQKHFAAEEELSGSITTHISKNTLLNIALFRRKPWTSARLQCSTLG
jgi:hemerythrin-like metal-binding protein